MNSALKPNPTARLANPPHSVAIIVPVLNEAAQLPRLLTALSHLCVAEDVSAWLVDGGSTDDTAMLARNWLAARPNVAQRITLLEYGRAQRALQMNAGAAQTSAEILLFLHADVRLPAGALALIRQALAAPEMLGGCFAFGFPLDVKLAYRVYAWGVNLRTRLFHTATGDQAIFIRRSAFRALGGFPPYPLMEDIALFHALKRQGRVVTLSEAAIISPRRWQQHGLIRTGLLMYALRFGYALGFDPATLKRFFLDVR